MKKAYMRLLLIFILSCGIILFSTSVRADEKCQYNPTEISNDDNEAWTLKRGVNLSKSWRGDSSQPLYDSAYKGLRKLGITFVRLPVAEPSLKLDDAQLQPKALNALRCDITSLLNNGLAVVLDFHPSKYLKPVIAKESPEDLEARLISYWTILQGIVSDLPTDKIYISILNEPPRGIKGWWEIQGRLVGALRTLFLENTFVVTASQGSYRDYSEKLPYPDKNVVYDFHFYKPLFFTHHNASWIKTPLDPREKTDKLRYPSAQEEEKADGYPKMAKYVGENWNKEKLAQILQDGPIAWSKNTGARIVCLEFGVYKYSVDKSSRARWLRDVRELFEANDIPWAMWDYNGGFGLYDRKSGWLDFAIAHALGLNTL